MERVWNDRNVLTLRADGLCCVVGFLSTCPPECYSDDEKVVPGEKSGPLAPASGVQLVEH